MNKEDVVVGETYYVRGWKEMADEYGMKEGKICVPNSYQFTEVMKSLCNTPVHIKGFKDYFVADDVPYKLSAYMLTEKDPHASQSKLYKQMQKCGNVIVLKNGFVKYCTKIEDCGLDGVHACGDDKLISYKELKDNFMWSNHEEIEI